MLDFKIHMKFTEKNMQDNLHFLNSAWYIKFAFNIITLHWVYEEYNTLFQRNKYILCEPFYFYIIAGCMDDGFENTNIC